MRAVAVTAPSAVRPSPSLPPLPLLADAVAGFEAGAWWGLLAPAGTPPAIVDLLNKDVNFLIEQPDMRTLFERLGVEPAPTTPARFAAIIAADVARWRKLAEQRSIRVD